MKQPWQIVLLLLVLGGCQRGVTVPQAAPAGSRAVSPPPVEAVGGEVAIRNFVYEPATVSIRVGERVRWTNHDAAPHDAVALTGSWKTPLLKINESATQAYAAPGVYPYYCTVHPAMRGTVVVRE